MNSKRTKRSDRSDRASIRSEGELNHGASVANSITPVSRLINPTHVISEMKHPSARSNETLGSTRFNNSDVTQLQNDTSKSCKQ